MTPTREFAKSAWNDLIDALRAMRSLKDDWDGDGSVAPTSALIEGAIRLANGFKSDNHPPADRVLAGVNGTICFEWHKALGYEEVEVVSPCEAEQRKVTSGSDIAEIARFTF